MEELNDLNSHFFSCPSDLPVNRVLEGARLEYFFLTSRSRPVSTGPTQAANLCVLDGSVQLKASGGSASATLGRFDFAYLPPGTEVTLEWVEAGAGNESNGPSKPPRVLLVHQTLDAEPPEGAKVLDVQRFSWEKFLPRGENGTPERMCTYREVWTAYANGVFMSGFTSIPSRSLRQGVVTSVNVDEGVGGPLVLPHTHDGYPEVYAFSISSPGGEAVAVTQYLVARSGLSVAREMRDGDGLFFPGHLGHANFARPTYKPVDHVLYAWIIPTFGRVDRVEPVTMRELAY